MPNDFPALPGIVSKLDALLPQTQPGGVELSGTFIVRKGTIPYVDPSPGYLLGGGSSNNNTINNSGSNVGSINTPYYLPPFTCVVRVGGTYVYGVPWLSNVPPSFGGGQTNNADLVGGGSGNDGQVWLASQPPYLFVFGNISGTTIGGTTWITTGLATNWSNVGAPYEVAAYRKVGDEVQLRGRVQSTAGGPATVLTLPAHYRPLKSHGFVSNSFNGGTAINSQILVASSGVVTYSSSTTPTAVDLDCVRFSVL